MSNRINIFEKLPLLERLTSQFQFNYDLSRVAFVCVQHLLETTGSLFEALIHSGVNPKNIFVLGKAYSTNRDTLEKLCDLGINAFSTHNPITVDSFKADFYQEIDKLWHSVSSVLQCSQIDLIVIVDDGARCITRIPDYITKQVSVIGIEQTTKGLKNLATIQPSIPVIEVASCAAKKMIESPIIAEAISRRTKEIIPRFSLASSIGIVGLGNIGKALLLKLVHAGHKIFVFDNDCVPESSIVRHVNVCSSLRELFQQSTFVFGCTGEDISKSHEELIATLPGNRYLISCSSENVEYCSMLRQVTSQLKSTQKDGIGFLTYYHRLGKLIFPRSGFPINFDNLTEIEPLRDIQLTRCLLFSAIIQAVDIYSHMPILMNSGCMLMLEPMFQKYIVKNWRTLGSEIVFKYPQSMWKHFDDLTWVKEMSAGNLYQSFHLSKYGGNYL